MKEDSTNPRMRSPSYRKLKRLGANKVMVLIFSGNRQEAVECARNEGLPRDRWEYLRDVPYLEIYRKGITVWRYGSWKRRIDWVRVNKAIATRNCAVVDKRKVNSLVFVDADSDPEDSQGT